MRSKSRLISPFVAAVVLVALAAVPSPAATTSEAPAPKVKDSTARAGQFRTPRAGAALQAPDSTIRMGFCGGDDWEPEITADAFNHVYVTWPHFVGDPTCDPASANPRDVYIQRSNDGGLTFGPPEVTVHVPYPSVVDTVITTNEVGHVFISFLAYGLTKDVDVLVARSTDFGQTFTWAKVNGPECTRCDHPWIVAHGSNVYVTYASGGNHYLSLSTDGGSTWTETNVLKADNVAFPEGGVLDASGNAWFAWGDCKGACTGKVAAHYRVSRTLAGSSNTDFAMVAEGPAGPDCPLHGACGFAYFGPQNDIAIDAAGNMYMVWQDGQIHDKPKSPSIVQLSRCLAGSDCTEDESWLDVGRVDDKTASGCAASQCYALFPRVEGGAAGHISAIWMDDRMGVPIDHMNGWNVWYRSSDNSGTSWNGPGLRVSEYDPARSESFPNGFLFPYGDYQGIDLTPGAYVPVMAWGEGHNYNGGPSAPGHVIYGTLP
jgi:hypothetical protein